ncbi:MAG: outer membrane beta-barrel family protein [Bacteroidota bacterium]|nr:outer membrane beta-barrel family protein [Bacteroidota bacterium]
MRKYITILLLLASVAVQGQNIKGKVCFEKDKTPVQFATVALLQLPDSAMITGVITLTDGGYLLEKIKQGNYFVRVSFVGYRTNGKAVTIGEGQGEIAVDTIFLAETTASLNEVTIVGERLKGKEMVDRTVYNIPDVVSKTSNNGYDILKKIPQVNVDFQNNITLNGSSNFIIQVDGRQRDREYLARLLPSDIQSIEIISNPSGKYEGNIDGVINIILKKEARYGMNGNIAGSLKPFSKVTSALTGSLDYSLGKITFYATAMNIGQALNISSTDESRFASIDSVTRMTGPGKIKVGLSSVNSGFDYYMNDKNNMSFNVSYKPIHQDVDLSGNTILYKNNIPLNTVASLTTSNLKSGETSLSLFYKKTFMKPVEEFTAEASYYIFRSDEGTDFTNTRHPYNSDQVLSTYSRVEDNLNKRNYFSTKLDYVYPIGMYSKIETGYQLYYQQMAYDFNIDYQEESNLFKYAELRNSVYGGITFNLKKIGFQAMLRVENSHIMADSVTSPNYSCYLPSANIQYKFSASHNLKFTYNRRINRPGIYDMNPYWRIGQNYAITQGNPDLRPDYRDRLQLTYTWNFGSNYFSPYVYDEFFSDRIGYRYSIIQSPITGSLTTISEPFNLLNGYELGGGVNAMLWYININARIYKGHYAGYTEPTFSIPARDYFSYTITSYAYVNLDKKKKTTAFVYLAYNGVNINAQSKTYSIPLYGLGAQRQFKNHSVGIFWLLPFTKNINFNRTETETGAFSSTNITGIDLSNFIQFSYSYKFNKGKNVKKLNRKVEVESDSKSNAIMQ